MFRQPELGDRSSRTFLRRRSPLSPYPMRCREERWRPRFAGEEQPPSTGAASTAQPAACLGSACEYEPRANARYGDSALNSIAQRPTSRKTKARASLDRGTSSLPRGPATPRLVGHLATMPLCSCFARRSKSRGTSFGMGRHDRGRFPSAHMGAPVRRVKPRSLSFSAPEAPPDPTPDPTPQLTH